jgi:para-aminobenzoate synthetase component 1
VEVAHDPAVLERPGPWAVVGTFEGQWTLARFATSTWSRPAGPPPEPWTGPAVDAWSTSLDEAAYRAAVDAVRARIATGEVYQVNVCRVLQAPLPDGADLDALATRLAAGNPAPFAARVSLPDHGIDVVSASPELFLRRDGDQVASAPIKGTGVGRADLGAKDVAENVMITDMVRNDLGRVCRPGSVEVRGFLDVEAHPGLVHLVSTVHGRLRAGVGWPHLLDALFPAASITGAPRSTARRVIADLEPVPRGVYCGTVGWIDGPRASLAVAIRTFAAADGILRFGTGAGITWGSDPGREWAETELKARRLVALASGAPAASDASETADGS